MSAENVNPAAGTDAAAPPKRRRGWFRRNWLWFIPTLILAIVVVGAGVLYWSFFVRVYRLDVVRAAMQKIESNKRLQEKLGQPIGLVWWPSQDAAPNARIEDAEKDVMWYVEGPKGRAKAELNIRLRAGQWQTTKSEVTLPGKDGEKVKLEGEGGDEAPPFEAPKPAGKKPEGQAPPDINLPVPPADAPS